MRKKFIPLIMLLLAACSFHRVYVVHYEPILDAPSQDLTVGVGTAITVHAHGEYPEGVAMNVILNDGHSEYLLPMSLTCQECSQGSWGLYAGDAQWTPSTAGEYRLFVRASLNGNSYDSESRRVRVLAPPPGNTPTVVPTLATAPTIRTTPEAVLTFYADSLSLQAGECTFLRWQVSAVQPQSIEINSATVPPQGEMQVCPCQTTTYDLIVFAGDKFARSLTIQVNGVCLTPTTPPPPNVLNFWADTAAVQAGGCTFLRWQTTNAVKVWLDGQTVPASGEARICLCRAETHTLKATFNDGTSQERSVTVNAQGTCQTPPAPATTAPPPQDTTPPPVPAPLNPGNTNEANPPTQYCPVILRWYPVSDPSGVTYRVRLEKQETDGSWSLLATWDTHSTEFAIPNSAQFCDYLTYRWRVRAVDGAGNAGNWSVWYYYTMPIP